MLDAVLCGDINGYGDIEKVVRGHPNYRPPPWTYEIFDRRTSPWIKVGYVSRLVEDNPSVGGGFPRSDEIATWRVYTASRVELGIITGSVADALARLVAMLSLDFRVSLSHHPRRFFVGR
jgi:hypothetical protein